MMTCLIISALVATLADFKFLGGNREVTMDNFINLSFSNCLKKLSELLIGVAAGFVALQSL